MVLYLALATALGFDALTTNLRRAESPIAHALPWLALLVMTAQLYAGNVDAIDRWREPPPPSMHHPERYHIEPGYDRYASLPARNVSTPGCYTGMEFRAAEGLWTGDVPQARIADGRVLAMTRSVNTIRIRVAAEGSAPLVVNQTFAVGWTSNVGRAARGPTGLIEVNGLPKGVQNVVLTYFPEELPLAVTLAAVGLVLAAFVATAALRFRATTPRDFFRRASPRTASRPQP
jgi:hypothetical protein